MGFPLKDNTTTSGKIPTCSKIFKCCSDLRKCMLIDSLFPLNKAIVKPFCKEKALKVLVSYFLFKLWEETNFSQFRLELDVIFKNFNYGLLDLS